MELMKPPSPNTNELITSEPIYGFIGELSLFENCHITVGTLASIYLVGF